MAARSATASAKAPGAADGSAGWVNGHPDDGVLHAGLDDQLPASESAAVADHVARCAACRTRVAEAHGLIAGARRIVKRVKELSEADPQTSTDILQYATASNSGGPQDSPTPAAPTEPDSQALAAGAPTAPAATPFARRESATSTAAQAGVTRIAKGRTLPHWLKLPHIPWNKVGLAASVLVVCVSVRIVWHAVTTDAGHTPPPATPAERPDAKVQLPHDAAQKPVAEPVVAATAVPEPTPPEPTLPLDSQPARTVSIDGALDAEPNASVAEFDSLVITRRSCASQCDEFVMFVSSAGSIHFVIRSPGGTERSDDGTVAAPSLRKMSALVSSTLFHTSAVPASGRSVCTVFDDAHVPTLQLMVAHGSSRALHANSCLAPSKALLKLGAQIDSLAGSDRLQKSVQNQK